MHCKGKQEFLLSRHRHVHLVLQDVALLHPLQFSLQLEMFSRSKAKQEHFLWFWFLNYFENINMAFVGCIVKRYPSIIGLLIDKRSGIQQKLNTRVVFKRRLEFSLRRNFRGLPSMPHGELCNLLRLYLRL